ncbi:MAG: M20/M25/M40 family metallo-hydrolase [Clostridia bacterium]|nr:M20/M25/M40 family metallo-hydrolase [Clostridia bacterium]
MINQERMVKEFMEMVRIDSLSKKEGEFAEYLKEKLNDMDLEVIVDEKAGRKAGSNTGNIIGKLKGNKEGVPTVLFSAHMDTVSPGEGIQPQVQEGVIYSDGSTILGSDDKAGIVAILEALRNIKEEKVEHGDIEVLFTVGEEIGLLGARYLDCNLLKSRMAFVLDSDGDPGTIISKAPAHNKISAVIHGKATHAGMNPENGVSAIQVAAKAIDSMDLLRIDEETTANIGMIKGGNATNIVCDKVEIEGEARSLSEGKLQKQTSHMVECLQNVCNEMGAQLEINIAREYPGFTINEDEEIIKIAQKAARATNLEVKVISSGGGSDTNYLSSNGFKAVNLGVGMSKVHTKEEFIKVESLVKTANYVSAIVEHIR